MEIYLLPSRIRQQKSSAISLPPSIRNQRISNLSIKKLPIATIAPTTNVKKMPSTILQLRGKSLPKKPIEKSDIKVPNQNINFENNSSTITLPKIGFVH